MTTIVLRTTAQVLDKVDAYVRENRHSDRSFVRDVLAGNTNREGLGRWAVQKFHQVYEQNRVFSAIHSVATSEVLRQFMIEQLISEETDIRDGSAPHYVLMRRFGLALGVPDSHFISTLPAPEVMTFVNFLLGLARTRPINCLLAIYINESQSHESASRLFRYLSSEFGLSTDDLEWFSVHGEADVEHAFHGREIIQKLADSEFIETAMDTAEEACRQWLNLHQFYADLHAGESTLMVS